MISKERLIFEHRKGLHARVAALIVREANYLQNTYKAKLFIGKDEDNLLPATSLISVASLNIKYKDEFLVWSKGEESIKPLQEFINFLKGEFDLEDVKTRDEVDRLLQEVALTMDKVFSNIANGVIIVDRDGVITSFNPAAAKITGLLPNRVIGEDINSVIANSKLKSVIESATPQIGQRQEIGASLIITNRTPILSGNKVIGAIAVFQDISTLERLSGELKEVKRLKERLNLILESVQDGICVIDKDGKIDYLNSSYAQNFQIDIKEALGKKVEDVLGKSFSYELLNKCEDREGIVSRLGDDLVIISNAYPIRVDNEVEGFVLLSKKKVEVEKMAHRLKELSAKAEYLEEELKRERGVDKAFERIIGKSGSLKEALVRASKASETSSTVLIRGESGTGKELVAEAIHYGSVRKEEAFIRVNCAAIPANLIESELFGHEKGAFTGAIRRKIGKFELAHKGTIFLDEIGELSTELQVKLLRVLQEREFERVGGVDKISVDLRIITATNRNLEQMMKNGEFREDLYYRLNVIPIILPPLKDRKSDIPLLANHFLEKISKKLGKDVDTISQEALNLLREYSWPGNVRELQNIIERGINFTENKIIDSKDLPAYIRSSYNRGESLINLKSNEEVATLEEYEKEIIKAALNKYNSFNAAGKVLGVTHKTVAAKARKYGFVD
ncbi:sigma 54-interacting transcriptional regulator [Halonatronum saccharophilum]|uniref:sigma 54-interacting transcriptional regulator n=1 Tax=Halonatronum saccharophilum TaxID=150060 RepID=UPI000480784A|nr:sigma 54-interacting transcriptional regulator [Halonatronum saccharophilum]